MGRRPKNELQALARASRVQLNLAEQLQLSLKQRAQVKKAVAGDLGWIPDEEWRRDFASVTNTLQHAGNSLMRAREANTKHNSGKSDEELMEQLVAQIVDNADALPLEVLEKIANAVAAKKGQ